MLFEPPVRRFRQSRAWREDRRRKDREAGRTREERERRIVFMVSHRSSLWSAINWLVGCGYRFREYLGNAASVIDRIARELPGASVSFIISLSVNHPQP